MINSDKAVSGSYYKGYNLPPEEEGLINNALPFEIFAKVLSYLDDIDMQSAATVSHLWNKVSIDTAIPATTFFL